MIHIDGYPRIYNLGHKAISELLNYPVLVEEKIDGSQISFALDGESVSVRSKGAVVYQESPGMFDHAMDAIKSANLNPGLVYRGEYLSKPKHNTLKYDRVPNNFIILFDVQRDGGDFLSRQEKEAESQRIGFECVPLLYAGMVSDADQLRALLARKSCLGDIEIEGVVIKPADYALFGRDKKVLMGKFVSETFKEVHQRTWKAEHGKIGPGEIIEKIAADIRTEAAWNKAIQHLRDAGLIEGDVRDIGKLIAELQRDTVKESEEYIKQKLFDWAAPQLKRMVHRGFPEWYKERLMEKQFS